jgi:hypothetical protein
MKLQFNSKYFIGFVVLLITEIMIALYLKDRIVRPYIGDLLVVILIYCFIKSFFATSVLKTAIAVLLFAFAVEALQYFNLVQKLGLQESKAARIIIGSSFEWKDMLAYTAGFALILNRERKKKAKLNNRASAPRKFFNVYWKRGYPAMQHSNMWTSGKKAAMKRKEMQLLCTVASACSC